MATYKEIFGKQVKFLSTDPVNESEGQIWYNTTLNNFRTTLVTEAWASGAPLATGRNLLGRAGTQTAALAISGYDLASNPPEVRTNVESYDGSGWSTAPVVNTARYGMQGDGSQTAAIIAGGISPAAPVYKNATETYDGSSWTTSPNTINTTRGYLGHAGGPAASTASIIFGGRVPPGPASTDSTETWDGSSWTAAPSLNNTGWGRYGCGTTTAALATGLETSSPPTSGTTEEYNGASWTTVNPNTAGQGFRGVAGIQTSALAFGGANAPAITTTEYYDGTNWSAKPALAVARGDGGGTGTATAALCFGDTTPSPTSQATEEFNRSTNIITAAAWAAGTNYPTTIQDPAGAGTSATTAIIYGGWHTVISNLSAEYNGSSWTATPVLNTARALYQTGTGTQTAALAASGYDTAPTGATEEWNGASWTTGNSMNTARNSCNGGGVQTSALLVGGSPPDNAESYNGLTWTVETVTPTNDFGGKGFSGQSETSNLFIGVAPNYTSTFTYNGSSWTDLGHTLVEGKTTPAGGSQQGTTTAAVIAGGFNPSPAVTTESQIYDGSAWASAPSMGTARRGGAAAGSATSCLGVGGEEPAQSNKTEEFTAETSAVNYKTITTS